MWALILLAAAVHAQSSACVGKSSIPWLATFYNQTKGCYNLCPVGSACNGTTLVNCVPPLLQPQPAQTTCITSPPCDASYYETAAPTATSARMCKALSPPCNVVTQVQTLNPTATTDRWCTCTSSFTGPTCSACSTFIPYCDTCINTSVCTSCWQGQRVAAGRCVPCDVSRCRACDTQNRCTLCDAGRVPPLCECPQSMCSDCNATACRVCTAPAVQLADGTCGWRGCHPGSARCTKCDAPGDAVRDDGHCAPKDCLVFDAATASCTRQPEATVSVTSGASVSPGVVSAAAVGGCVAVIAAIVAVVRTRYRRTMAGRPLPVVPPAEPVLAAWTESEYMQSTPIYDNATQEQSYYTLASPDTGYLDVSAEKTD